MPKTYKMDLMKLVDQFHNEDACLEYLEELRWPDGPTCPRCDATSVSHLRERGLFDCNKCSYQYSVRVGTIFHDSHLPLWKWFVAVYLMLEGKKGVSANQLKRTLGMSYKTAWYLCHRIRAAMGSGEQEPLAGIVEVDETFIGGKVKGKGRAYKGNKAIVAGAVQRGGEIRLEVVSDTTRESLHRFIRTHTHPATEAIYTDEWPAYRGIEDHDTRHETVNHSQKEYVRGNVHTNTVENAWSLFKRGIVGSYHKLSEKHIDAYLDEFEWRQNNRDNPFIFRDTLLKLIGSENLPFQTLVG